VALVDPSDLRRAQRQIEWPAAQAFASVGELITSGTEIHAAELLLPTTLNEEVVMACLTQGWHVNLQKPFANDPRARSAWPTKLSGEVFNSG